MKITKRNTACRNYQSTEPLAGIKMPNFRAPNVKLIETLIDDGGVTKETKDKRTFVQNQFDKYLKNFFGGKILKNFWESESDQEVEAKIATINTALCGFFEGMTVKARSGEEMAPKRNTADAARSHLKKVFYDITGLDITGKKFEKFNVSTYLISNV